MSKYLAEQLCEFYAKSLDVPCVVLRLFNVYGPGQKPEFLIPTLIENVKKGQVVELRSPKSVRDYVYIDDVLALFDRCLESDLKNNFTVLNVASGQGYSVLEVVNAIKLVSGRDVEVVSNQSAVGDTFTADISKVKSVLGWEPKISFEKGLGKIL
ncbi:MAG: NAD-dependent epimerase/dehydratase, partial [Parcubacteria group bacterium Gr01-1014_70]